jgi:hypothetical protein
MHGYSAPLNRYDTLIPCEIRAEAEEKVEHRSYNATQHNRMAVFLQMISFGFLYGSVKGNIRAASHMTST